MVQRTLKTTKITKKEEEEGNKITEMIMRDTPITMKLESLLSI